MSDHGGLHPAQPFPAAAHEQVVKAQLRANLRKVTTTIRAKRANVVEELPHWEQLRTLGAATKDASLVNLSDRLLQLEQSVRARGGYVHWARDAKEARDLVARIAEGHGVDELIKVKSITSDEIELNRALEERGIHAVETTSPNSSCSSRTTGPATSSCRPSTATGRRFRRCSTRSCPARARCRTTPPNSPARRGATCATSS